ncbi:MAG: hypothetical protein QOE52_4951 [Mycobacterium sp.]|jgi:hypothetical protein|nr:hypothetical protein [Mycobacterium sp.]MDT5345767.1 hypothetical protein [Mycobacterium sp.]
MLSPSCGHGMQSLPVVGLVTAAVGIWLAAKALRGGDVKASGKLPRHAAKTSSVRPILFFLGNAAFITLGGVLLRAGLGDGVLSLVGLAIAVIGTSILAILTGVLYSDLR